MFSMFFGFLGTLPPDPIRGSPAGDRSMEPPLLSSPPKQIPGYAPVLQHLKYLISSVPKILNKEAQLSLTYPRG